MKYPYFSRPYKDSKTLKTINNYRPEIPVRLCNGHKLNPTPILALIDSGADNNLFPSVYALYLGLKFRKGEKRIITGIGNNKIIAYRNPIVIYVDDYKVTTYIDFCECQQTPILGRNDFFKFFKAVEFNENKKTVDLKV